MVSNVTSFSRSGLADWLIQRFSAIILTIYSVGILGYLVMNPDLQYAQWQALFSATWMRVTSLLVVVAICAHAWIGMWTVATDYLTEAAFGSKATVIRLSFQAVCVIVIFTYLVWGVQILWGF
jgi:succinate dehydrogenase / fumarate reductase, membrane anchor subunit